MQSTKSMPEKILIACRLIEVEYAEIEDRKVRSQLQNVGAIERQVGKKA